MTPTMTKRSSRAPSGAQFSPYPIAGAHSTTAIPVCGRASRSRKPWCWPWPRKPGKPELPTSSSSIPTKESVFALPRRQPAGTSRPRPARGGGSAPARRHYGLPARRRHPLYRRPRTPHRRRPPALSGGTGRAPQPLGASRHRPDGRRCPPVAESFERLTMMVRERFSVMVRRRLPEAVIGPGAALSRPARARLALALGSLCAASEVEDPPRRVGGHLIRTVISGGGGARRRPQGRSTFAGIAKIDCRGAKETEPR